MNRSKYTMLVLNYFAPVVAVIGITLTFTVGLLSPSQAEASTDLPVVKEVQMGEIISHTVTVQTSWFDEPKVANVTLPAGCVRVGKPAVTRQSLGLGVSNYCITVKFRPLSAGTIEGGSFFVKTEDEEAALEFPLPSFMSIPYQGDLQAEIQFAPEIELQGQGASTDTALYLLIGFVLILLIVPVTLCIRTYLMSYRKRALRNLVRLKSEYVKGEIVAKELLVGLSDVVSSFLSSYLNEDLSTMTTSELVVFLNEDVEAIDFGQRQELIDLLEEIEIAVFADLPLEVRRITDAVDEIYNFIDKCPQEAK